MANVNSWDLPFRDLWKPTRVAGFHIPSKTVVFNSSSRFTEAGAEYAERYCEGILSHEVLHGVLIHDVDYETCDALDNVDGWDKQYTISFPFRTSSIKKGDKK